MRHRHHAHLAAAAAVVTLLLGPTAQAGEVTVAVATNFAGPLAKIAEGFHGLFLDEVRMLAKLVNQLHYCRLISQPTQC